MTPIKFIRSTLRQAYRRHLWLSILLVNIIIGVVALVQICKGVNITLEMLWFYYAPSIMFCMILNHIDFVRTQRQIAQAYDHVQSENAELATAILEKKVFYKPEIRTILDALSDQLDADDE